MNELLLEPLKYYDTVGKQAHEENTRQYFDDLLKKSGVDEEENRRTVKEYNEKVEEINGLSKILSRFKFFKVMLIIAAIVGGIMAIASFVAFGEDAFKGILLLLFGGGIIAGAIYLLKKR